MSYLSEALYGACEGYCPLCFSLVYYPFQAKQQQHDETARRKKKKEKRSLLKQLLGPNVQKSMHFLYNIIYNLVVGETGASYQTFCSSQYFSDFFYYFFYW